jgi:hypothetical protein
VAVMVPLLLLILCAIFGNGAYYAFMHNVQQLTTETAQATVAGLTPAERQQIAANVVDTAIAGYPLLRRDHLKVNVADSRSDPAVYRVTLTYDASYTGIWTLQSIVPMPSAVIEHSSTIRRGRR